jgi:hypothetical protein
MERQYINLLCFEVYFNHPQRAKLKSSMVAEAWPSQWPQADRLH